MEKSTVKNPFVEILIATAATLAVALISEVYLFAAVLIPVIGAFITARHDAAWTIAYYTAAAAILFFIIPAHWWISSVMLLLAALPCGICIRKKLPAYESIIISVAGWLPAIAAAIIYTNFIVGTDLITYATKEANLALEESPALANMLYLSYRYKDIMSGTLTQEVLSNLTHSQILKYLASEKIVDTLMGCYLPTLIMGMVVIGGFGSYLLARFIAKKRGTDVRRIPPFERFYLPRKVSTYFILSYLIAQLPMLFGWERFYLSGYVLSALVTTVFFIQGISFIEFLLKHKIKRTGPRALLVAGITITATGLLSYVGFFEQFIRIRDAKFTIMKNNNGGENK